METVSELVEECLGLVVRQKTRLVGGGLGEIAYDRRNGGLDGIGGPCLA